MCHLLTLILPNILATTPGPVVEQGTLPPLNPCVPSPCGSNAQCTVDQGQAVCACLANMIGTSPNCRPQCVISSECASEQTCINQKCVDPCPGSCAPNADCRVVNHSPICSCIEGYTGDAFSDCRPKPVIGKLLSCLETLPTHFDLNSDGCVAPFLKISIVEPHSNTRVLNASFLVEPNVAEPRPCDAHPCGTNAECRQQGQAVTCVCPPDYVGDPYSACRPECVLNTDCSRDKSCFRNKCVDPCPGTCGINAQCRVSNHVPVCTCLTGHTGDPYGSCRPISVIRKLNIISDL